MTTKATTDTPTADDTATGPESARAGTDHAAGPAGAPHSDLVAVLGRPHTATADELGGKGARLDELTAAGLPVPSAFCLTTGLFDLFLRESGLAAEIRAAEARAEPALTVREAILARDVPEPIARTILAAYEDLGRPRVAVRSSAPREDSAERSFAGQHDTVLDVSGDAALLDAVKVCWASLWSDRAAAYRSGPGPAGSIAVVVQEMVPADVSGVLFTVDPIGGRPNRLVVEACCGLGEGLVSGRVSSDFFVVDDRTLDVVEERVRYKVTKCASLSPGRIGMTKVDAADRDAPCLTRDQLAALARLALDVRERYGTEQDIEWAMRDGTLHLLQARPITTRPRPETSDDARSPYLPQHLRELPDATRHGTLWSRMDIGEIFVGLMSPLGLSFARHYQDHVHGDCAAALGVRDTGDVGLHMGFFQGHVYLNISYTAYLLGQAVPTRDQRHFTRRFVSEEVDLATYENPFGTFPGGMADLLSTTHWLRATGNEMLVMKGRARDMAEARLYEFDRARRLDLTRMGRRELGAELTRYLDYFHDAHVGYMPYYINAFGFYGILTELCAKWLGSAGDNLQNRIKTDMSSLRTVASAQEIWSVAQAAKARPRVMEIIEAAPLEEVADRLRADPDGEAFWQSQMEPFLRANGTRGRQEMELTHQRWIDDPSYIFQMIRRYAADGFTADDIMGRSRARQEGDTRAVLKKLPLPQRKTLEGLISMYALCSELRETTRMSMITSIWLVRNVVYEVGRQLVDEGVLHSLDEVAFLDFADVRGYLAGELPAREAFSRPVIEERRRVHEYHNRLPEPPLTFVGEHDSTRAARPVKEGTRLEGLGSSPGRIVGRARIVEDLVWQADEFQAGEILVTRHTDASWTPLFAIAGGVVTDIGSMLSHSSIVSREFNVPSVVNTKYATQVINTGDMVMVDGDTGVVEVVEG
ncbi:PEP/pyruvate-binding domain-containing protein [Streptomyces aurantiacus]|uniref:Putative phosphotransferase YvkC n=1 Tax=Streptomyces aurantiacus JA 4570 TaxID=1286094 RepID=S3ZKG0_9ACTN|nr:PEP/pyruvate-binding domain-containing protein [Streptomyces aurantiacus]EPH43673.1 putative phosphotransferase YvkC [Streptomyces aurantiacus JA 4570]